MPVFVTYTRVGTLSDNREWSARHRQPAKLRRQGDNTSILRQGAAELLRQSAHLDAGEWTDQ